MNRIKDYLVSRNPFTYIPMVLAEFAGSYMLMCIGLIGCNKTDWGINHFACHSFGSAASLALAIEIFGSVSGGHFNPGVTIAVAVLGKLDLVQCLTYLLAQYAGALLGQIYMTVNRQESISNFEEWCDSVHMNQLLLRKGFRYEMFLCSGWILSICAMLDPRNGYPGKSASIRLAIIIIGSTCTSRDFSGVFLFPTQIVFNNFVCHSSERIPWTYQFNLWIVGIICGLIYRFIFDASESYSLYSQILTFHRNFSVLRYMDRETSKETSEPPKEPIKLPNPDKTEGKVLRTAWQRTVWGRGRRKVYRDRFRPVKFQTNLERENLKGIGRGTPIRSTISRTNTVTQKTLEGDAKTIKQSQELQKKSKLMLRLTTARKISEDNPVEGLSLGRGKRRGGRKKSGNIVVPMEPEIDAMIFEEVGIEPGMGRGRKMKTELGL